MFLGSYYLFLFFLEKDISGCDFASLFDTNSYFEKKDSLRNSI